MAKGKKAAVTPAAAPAVATIQLVPGAVANFRANSARAAWYAHLQACVGQTPAQFAAAAIANPPSTPKHGKLASQCEPPAGWLQYFTRNGYAVVTK